MNYEDLLRDFVRRMRRNPQIVRDAEAGGVEAYEVTQLINSMLGLVVLPRESYFEQIPQKPLEELRAEGWPEPVLEGEFGRPRNLRDLMRLIRNGIAHWNMEFISEGQAIRGVRIWNERPTKTCECPGCAECGKWLCSCRRGKQKTWQVTLRLSELQEMTDRFVALVLDESTGSDKAPQSQGL